MKRNISIIATFISLLPLPLSFDLSAQVGYNPFPNRPDPWEVAYQLGYISTPNSPWPPPPITASRPGFGAAMTHPAIMQAYRARYGPRALDEQGRTQPGPCGAENVTSLWPRVLEVMAKRGDFGPYNGAQPSHREVEDMGWDPACARFRSIVTQLSEISETGSTTGSTIASSSSSFGPLPRPSVKADKDSSGLRIVLQVPQGPSFDGWEAQLDTGIVSRRLLILPPINAHYLPNESAQRIRFRATQARKRGPWSEWAQILVALEPPPEPTPQDPDVVETTLCLRIADKDRMLQGPGPWTIQAELCGQKR